MKSKCRDAQLCVSTAALSGVEGQLTSKERSPQRAQSIMLIATGLDFSRFFEWSFIETLGDLAALREIKVGLSQRRGGAKNISSNGFNKGEHRTIRKDGTQKEQKEMKRHGIIIAAGLFDFSRVFK